MTNNIFGEPNTEHTQIVYDLSRQGIIRMPNNILSMSNLKMLYLNDNQLWGIPDDFFDKLPVLKFLDLQWNRLCYIPSGIVNHRCLEDLFLNNNRIKKLPVELAFVPNLKVITLSSNPIVYPPRKIIDGGLERICQFMRTEYSKYSKIHVESTSSSSSLTSSDMDSCNAQPSLIEDRKIVKVRNDYARYSLPQPKMYEADLFDSDVHFSVTAPNLSRPKVMY